MSFIWQTTCVYEAHLDGLLEQPVAANGFHRMWGGGLLMEQGDVIGVMAKQEGQSAPDYCWHSEGLLHDNANSCKSDYIPLWELV